MKLSISWSTFFDIIRNQKVSSELLTGILFLVNSTAELCCLLSSGACSAPEFGAVVLYSLAACCLVCRLACVSQFIHCLKDFLIRCKDESPHSPCCRPDTPQSHIERFLASPAAVLPLHCHNRNPRHAQRVNIPDDGAARYLEFCSPFRLLYFMNLAFPSGFLTQIVQ